MDQTKSDYQLPTGGGKSQLESPGTIRSVGPLLQPEPPARAHEDQGVRPELYLHK